VGAGSKGGTRSRGRDGHLLCAVEHTTRFHMETRGFEVAHPTRDPVRLRARSLTAA